MRKQDTRVLRERERMCLRDPLVSNATLDEAFLQDAPCEALAGLRCRH
jgi:hypothetical protein